LNILTNGAIWDILLMLSEMNGRGSFNGKRLIMKFAVCILSDGYDDLESRKIYRILSDEKAERAGCLRVIDESGEDCLYPADRFLIAEFSEEIQTKLLDSVREAA
jgi:hypothetical protein